MKSFFLIVLTFLWFGLRGQTLPIPSVSTGQGNNYFIAGTGDGGTLSTYNSFLRLHWGMAIGSPYVNNGSGGYIEKATISFDGRTGNINTLGNVGVGTTNPVSEFQVNSGYQKISLGRLTPQVGQNLGWASQYIGLNVARGSQGWLVNSDGGHNGGSLLIGDAFGQFRIANIPSNGVSDQYLTEEQINQNTKFVINSSGYVGIGGVNARSPLEVRVAGDNNSVQTAMIIQQTNPGSPNNKTGVSLDFGLGNNTFNNSIEGRITVNETYWGARPKMLFSLWDENSAMKDRLVIDTYGRVGIGTTNPNEELTVKGTVYSTEVKVDINAGSGPDYVFETDYPLPSLDSIKSYIDQNKHLPEVPSAKDMESNGVNLGEMNMLLLKKIEELMLYTLELKKENEIQQTEIRQLQKYINKN